MRKKGSLIRFKGLGFKLKNWQTACNIYKYCYGMQWYKLLFSISRLFLYTKLKVIVKSSVLYMVGFG